MKQSDLIPLLIQTDAYLQESREWLLHSYQICSAIGKKKTYSIEEMDAFEALSSRFARSSDIFMQQMFRTINMIELEPGGSTLDRINRAEKTGCIESAYDLRTIREIRNTIVHEYRHNEIIQLFHDLLDATPLLLESIDSTHTYISRYIRT